MKNIVVSIWLIICSITTYAQVSVGLKYDVNGMPFDGYYDALTYKPFKKISINGSNSHFENGYYFDAFGKKTEGLIKFEKNKFFYKNRDDNNGSRLKVDEVYSIVLGVDSFFTTKNFYKKKRLIDSDEFVQFVAEVDGVTFVKYYQKLSPYNNSTLLYEDVYMAKSTGDLFWDSFDKKKYFKNAQKYFGKQPIVASKIENNDFSKDDIFTLIKELEYFEKFTKNESILYNKYWQETRNYTNSYYSARILNANDSVWTLNYYKDSLKLYQVNYSSFYPTIKSGEFTCYYPNGTFRKVITYNKNEAKEVKIFRNENLKKHYSYSGEEGDLNHDRSLKLNYKFVGDSLNNNVIATSAKSKITTYDTAFNVMNTNIFVSDKLKTSSRLFGKDTVFHITNPSFEYNLDKLQVRFNDYIMFSDFNESTVENAQGIILVSLIIDKKGFVMNAEVLNKIHPKLDKLVSDFVNFRLLNKYDSGLKFKPLKKNGEKRFFEIVIPFEFNDYRFYRVPVNSYWYNNNWHWHNHLMHQQHFMPTINPPSMPRAF